jgi:hypothetical protein
VLVTVLSPAPMEHMVPFTLILAAPLRVAGAAPR